MADPITIDQSFTARWPERKQVTIRDSFVLSDVCPIKVHDHNEARIAGTDHHMETTRES